MQSSENKDLLERIAEKIRTCKSCNLYKGTTQAVPGEGSGVAKVFFIGEGPGFYEDKTGRPFVGRAGQLLEQALKKIGLSREEVFIGNVVKHRPPENRDPLPSEITACNPWLEQQLAIIRPKVIVTLGRYSMNKFLPGSKISYVHGIPKKVNGQIILPMYHPAAALRSNSLLKTFEEDFLKNKEFLVNPETAVVEENKDENDKDPNQIGLFT